MLFESARNEASASAALVNMWAASSFVWAAMCIMFATDFIWMWLLFAICLVVATLQVRNVLPTLNGVQYGVL